MKFFDTIKGKAAILAAAQHYGQTPEEIRSQIQSAIDAAWEGTDPAAQAFRNILFPEKPTPEQFIIKIADLAKTSSDP